MITSRIRTKLILASMALALSPFVMAHADETATPPDRPQLSTDQKERLQQRREEFKQKAEEHFKQVDKDGSGTISLEEAKTGFPRLAEHFDEVDANHDGQISPDEMREFAKEKAQERRAERQKRCADKAGANSSQPK